MGIPLRAQPGVGTRQRPRVRAVREGGFLAMSYKRPKGTNGKKGKARGRSRGFGYYAFRSGKQAGY